MRLALFTSFDAVLILLYSTCSLVKLLTFNIRNKFDKLLFNVSIVSLIFSYLLAIVVVNLKEPKIINRYKSSIYSWRCKNVPPITITVSVEAHLHLYRNLSSWFTSSFNIAIKRPDDLFSKYVMSRERTF